VEARRKRAPSVTARSSRCSVPTDPTRRISTGMVVKSLGLAGEAMCKMASNRPDNAGWWSGRPSQTSCLIRVNSGLSARWATFSSDPVMKLSTATTRHPRPMSASTTWEGTKPAPPLTRMRWPAPKRGTMGMPASLLAGGIVPPAVADKRRNLGLVDLYLIDDTLYEQGPTHRPRTDQSTLRPGPVSVGYQPVIGLAPPTFPEQPARRR